VDDKGQKEPHQLTFVFKTGPKSTISMGKEPYSHLSPDTCGDGCASGEVVNCHSDEGRILILIQLNSKNPTERKDDWLKKFRRNKNEICFNCSMRYEL
jgi:hypothetical protein